MNQSKSKPPIDCVIVGGGPAGLTASIYLARFHLSAVVIDAGHGRAAQIPLSHNHAGFPEGISGVELLSRMRAQSEKYGAQHLDMRVVSVSTNNTDTDGPMFVARAESIATEGSAITAVCARTVLLATGVINRRPDIPSDLHDEALRRGLFRYCPVCDAYEVTDKAIGLIGTGSHGLNEARFLRAYSSRVALVAPQGAHELNGTERALADSIGIELLDGPCSQFELQDNAITLALVSGHRQFDTIYAALGTDICSELALSLGADSTDELSPLIDNEQRTSIEGLYAAGDMVNGLDQISFASGQGAAAATAIRNDLAARKLSLR